MVDGLMVGSRKSVKVVFVESHVLTAWGVFGGNDDTNTYPHGCALD